MLKSKAKLRGGNSDGFEPIPEGFYTAQIIDVNETTWTNSFSGEEVDGFEYKFAILNDEELPESGESTRGRYLWWRVSNSIHKKSNLTKLAVAALGRKLTDEEMDTDSDECFDVESIVGLQVLVDVEQNKSKKDDRVYNNVSNVSIAGEELEPIEEVEEESTVVETKSKPIKKTPMEKQMEEEEEDEEETDDLDGSIANPVLDEIIAETLADEEEEEEEDDEDEDDGDEDELDEEEIARREAALERSKAKLAKAKEARKEAKASATKSTAIKTNKSTAIRKPISSATKKIRR